MHPRKPREREGMSDPHIAAAALRTGDGALLVIPSTHGILHTWNVAYR
jgi:hypothetical protein